MNIHIQININTNMVNAGVSSAGYPSAGRPTARCPNIQSNNTKQTKENLRKLDKDYPCEDAHHVGRGPQYLGYALAKF